MITLFCKKILRINKKSQKKTKLNMVNVIMFFF